MAVTKNLVNIGDACISGDLEANKIVKRGGTSSLFLKADGSTDSTTYISTAGTGLSKSGNTLNHSSSITAGTVGTSSATSGSTLAVPYITYNASGHITGVGTHTHTITGFSTTDTKVTQTNTTSSNDYRVLFSSTSNDSTLTEGARKSTKLKFNPSTGVLTVTGTVNASTGFFQTSDARKKNVIGDLDLNKAYELIDKCQTILYTLKDDPSNKHEIGLIAQEVREIFPELISEDETGMLSLDYARLTVIILKVLKDLISRISKLEASK